LIHEQFEQVKGFLQCQAFGDLVPGASSPTEKVGFTHMAKETSPWIGHGIPKV
jgi:hypothetical protein